MLGDRVADEQRAQFLMVGRQVRGRAADPAAALDDLLAQVDQQPLIILEPEPPASSRAMIGTWTSALSKSIQTWASPRCASSISARLLMSVSLLSHDSHSGIGHDALAAFRHGAEQALAGLQSPERSRSSSNQEERRRRRHCPCRRGW